MLFLNCTKPSMLLVDCTQPAGSATDHSATINKPSHQSKIQLVYFKLTFTFIIPRSNAVSDIRNRESVPESQDLDDRDVLIEAIRNADRIVLLRKFWRRSVNVYHADLDLKAEQTFLTAFQNQL